MSKEINDSIGFLAIPTKMKNEKTEKKSYFLSRDKIYAISEYKSLNDESDYEYTHVEGKGLVDYDLPVVHKVTGKNGKNVIGNRIPYNSNEYNKILKHLGMHERVNEDTIFIDDSIEVRLCISYIKNQARNNILEDEKAMENISERLVLKLMD